MPTFLAWNLRHGGGVRGMPHITLALLEHNPDVLVLSEFRGITGGQIAGILADHGWSHQVDTKAPKGTNGLLIASRYPLRCEPSGAPPSGALAHAALLRRYAEVEIPALDLALAGLNIPCYGNGLGWYAFFPGVLAPARRRRDQAFIVMGDFNAGRHHLDENGATFTCTRCIGQLAAMGYADAFRRLHPSAREFTWYTHEGAGFRLDHAFNSAPLTPRLRACRYSHRERESKLSDHSALILTLAEPAKPTKNSGKTAPALAT